MEKKRILLKRLAFWFDTRATDPSVITDTRGVDPLRVVPFPALHLAAPSYRVGTA